MNLSICLIQLKVKCNRLEKLQNDDDGREKYKVILQWQAVKSLKEK